MSIFAVVHREPAAGEELLQAGLAAAPEVEGRREIRGNPGSAWLGGTWLPSATGGLAESPRHCLFLDGLVENRSELAHLLGSRPGSSSAEVALAAWEHWGEAGFGRLEGPFVLIVWDRTARRLLAARDVLGGRTLAYRHRGEELLLASDLGSLLYLPGVSSDVNEVSIARLFALQGPRPGETFFSELAEVPPGHLLELRDGNLRLARYGSLEPATVHPSRSDEDQVEELQELLRRAVADYLPDERLGILLSGGLDSGTLACVAAEELRSAGRESPVALSFVFDELPCDERDAMRAVVERHGLEWETIVSDDLWPLCPLSPPPDLPVPIADLYGASHVLARRRARSRGLRVVWSGFFGDHLYVDGGLWLRSLVWRGRWVEALASLRRQRERQRAGLPIRGSLKGAIARVVLDPRRRPAQRAWLTPEAASLAGDETSPGASPPGARDAHWRAYTEPLCLIGSALSVAQASRDGIDLRFPYHHRRLVAWALATPAHLLYRPGTGKLVLREAMRGSLPEEVRTRVATTTLTPLAARGLVEREHARVTELLAASDAWWPRFVSREWLATHFPSRLARREDGVESFIAWTCICLEQWRRDLAAGARAA